MQPLLITTINQDGARVLLIAGEIDLTTSTRFATTLTGALAPDTTLILDMSAVTFMDAQGLRVLLAAQRGVAALGARLAIVPSPPVSRILEITGADQHLDLHHDRVKALASTSPNTDKPTAA